MFKRKEIVHEKKKNICQRIFNGRLFVLQSKRMGETFKGKINVKGKLFVTGKKC